MAKRKNPAIVSAPAAEGATQEAAPVADEAISLGIAAHISWVLRLSEADAVKATEILKQWSGELSEGSETFARCESPAERLFLLGFLLDGVCAHVDWSDYEVEFGGTPDRVARPFATNLETKQEESFVLYQQALVGPYRVDFLIEHNGFKDCPSWGLAIEIDGHDFHERTKEQAAHDKSRDRSLVALGYHTLRFTGSEVYADPAACAMQVLAIATTLEQKRSAYDNHVMDAYWAGHRKALERPANEQSEEPQGESEAGSASA